MTELVFRDYDQAGLDAQYDNRAKVPAFAEYMDRWQRLSRETRERLSAQLNVAYGPSREEVLDIFPGRPGAPIHIFYHGGYWRALHKDDFSFVVDSLQPTGVTTVIVNYALVPSVDMAELVRQCRAALAWVWHNAASFGGDRERIYISGHSAGGHLVAMMMATDWPAFAAGLPSDPLRAGCGISGLYDLEPIRLCFLNADLAMSRADAAALSPVLLPRHCSGTLVLPLGDLEGPEYFRQSSDLAAAWANTEIQPMAGHDHFSIAAQLEDPDSELASIIHRQMGVG
ncbi:MAG: alpha/beta hydrolase [Gammaproteobacteria bacterium]|nr:alpha/beta hydrolase [Gammaproteobacteria bacterium]